MYNVASRLLSNPKASAEDQAEALSWQKQAAGLGCGDSCFNLGVGYVMGLHGKKQDQNVAVEWFKRGTKLGNAMCMLRLAYHYRDALGVERDYGEAVRLATAAAEADHGSACYTRGSWSLHGIAGLPEDRVEAVRWFKRGAELRNAECQSMYGVECEAGARVPLT